MNYEWEDKKKEMGRGGEMSFKGASTRFMDVFDEQEMVVRLVGVKRIQKEKRVPEGAKAAEQGMPWCEVVRIAATEGEAVVILAVTPKQALLAIQGYNFRAGNRFVMSTIGIRGVCADLPPCHFWKKKLNGSFFCLGARALGGWGGNLLGLGMPFSIFLQMVTGMEKSAEGFPYKAYPK
jgi:uncharacterized protein (DUF169 family)